MPGPHLDLEQLDRVALSADPNAVAAPLRAHLDRCARCRDAVERTRRVDDLLARLPELSPRSGFGSQVLSSVTAGPLFQPAAPSSLPTGPLPLAAAALGGWLVLLAALASGPLAPAVGVVGRLVWGAAWARAWPLLLDGAQLLLTSGPGAAFSPLSGPSGLLALAAVVAAGWVGGGLLWALGPSLHRRPAAP